MDEDSANSEKQRKVTLGEALDKQYECNSATWTASWVIEEFEHDFNSSDEPIEKRVPSILS